MISAISNKGFRVVFSLLSFTVPIIVYIITLAPTISYTDSGELALACIKLAIAHPTGYPLFTILGKIFYLFHFEEEAYVLNLMCAIFSSLAVLLFFKTITLILNNVKILLERKKSNVKLNDFSINIIGISSSFLLAFSRTFWDSANSIEVWSLHNLFINLLIYIIIKASIKNSEKYYLLFAYILGLSFSNHISTTFALVGFIYFYFAQEGVNKTSLKKIVYMIIPFFIGISTYIYLIIRANNNIITWIFPLDLYNLYYHITGKHFSGLMFKSFKSSIEMLGNFFEFYPKEFFYFPLLISTIGMFFLMKISRKYFLFTILLFVINILFAINYEILDFENYYFLTAICTSIWFAFGLLFLIVKTKLKKVFIFIIAIGVQIFPFSQNYSKVDESNNFVIRDYYMNFVNSVPENSVVVTEGMDVAMLASFYFQIVKGIRQDVVIFNDNLVSSAPWYIKFLEIHYKDFYNKSRDAFEIYKNNIIMFHCNKSENFDKKNLFMSYVELYKNIIQKNNVYFTQEFFRQYLQNSVLSNILKEYNLVPYGLFYKVTKEKDFVDDGSPVFTFQTKNKPLKKLLKEDPFYMIIMYAYYNGKISRASYLIQYEKFSEAEKLIREAQKIIPEEQKANQMLSMLNRLKDQQKQK